MPLAFVTGGSGFIGSHVLRCLIRRGWKVRALTRRKRLPCFLHLPEVSWIYGTLHNSDLLRQTMKDCDALFHIAADYRLWARNPAEIYFNNVDGTRCVLKVATEVKIGRVVYTSSVGALGLNDDGTPANEATPVTIHDMVGHYKRSKYLAEREAERFAREGLDVVIVNPSTPIGPGDYKPTPTGKIIVDFMNGRMPAYVNTGLNFVDVRDVAEGHLLAYEKGRTGEKYILGCCNMSLKEFLDKLSEVCGIPTPKYRIPLPIVKTAALICEAMSRFTGIPPAVPLEGVRMSEHFMYFDVSKAVRELGLPQSPIDVAIKDAVHWYIEHGYC